MSTNNFNWLNSIDKSMKFEGKKESEILSTMNRKYKFLLIFRWLWNSNVAHDLMTLCRTQIHNLTRTHNN